MEQKVREIGHPIVTLFFREDDKKMTLKVFYCMKDKDKSLKIGTFRFCTSPLRFGQGRNPLQPYIRSICQEKEACTHTHIHPS